MNEILVVALLLIVLLAIFRPRDKSRGESEYFSGISKALADAGIGKPTLVVDRARLLNNTDAVVNHLKPLGLETRVAMKSLPSIGLLDEITGRIGTNRMMVFNLEYLKLMSSRETYLDLLLGKPLPVLAVDEFFRTLPDRAPNAKSVEDIQWLVDTFVRVKEYAEVAEKYSVTLKLNFELDVGIHRGGFSDSDEIKEALEFIKSNPRLQFAGLMGYEKHVYYVAFSDKGRMKALDSCLDIYRKATEQVHSVFGVNDGLTMNMAGSVTYKMYSDNKVANELSIGSGFVKPTHFDTKTLAAHLPAAYIATPVIKRLEGLRIPADFSIVNTLLAWWNPNKRQTFFVYGGLWDVTLAHPMGLIRNKFFGTSSNQESWTGSKNITLKPNDFVFMRPNESEAVFTQFGEIAVYDDGKIVDYWETLPAAP